MGVGLVDITAKRAALTPNRIAFEHALTGATLTYAQLEDRASRGAAVLAAFGVEREDRVAILCRNRVEFFELMFACAKIGAIYVPLNWRAPASELLPVLADCTPKVLVYGAEDEACAHAIGGGLRTIGLDADYEDLLAAHAPLVTDAQWRDSAIWTLIRNASCAG